ncbi:hypothetical protein CV102_08365 [Natronococcus pandeyae]|uniref:Uncharacterized protein n=1 Tax=Natronococcus pandeyae TaxID=2055836 RepID=A0A8J8Q5P9_9EURY|nr:hypothetical protein [Natronococcus pandeyae]TYL39282.1 hypothetical protein CV102_08365 [Natronococcus pandeyae]
MSTRVAESTGYGPNSQMSIFGYVVAALVVIVLLPVLPLFVIGWLIWRAFLAPDEEEHSFEKWRRESGRPPGDT